MMPNKFFPEVNGNFGFGCMRLPMLEKEVDLPQFEQMVDQFLAAGFNYFDTAHGYIGGKSETAIRDGLSRRYPRDRFILTDKLTAPYFNSEADILPLFEKQLEACGVAYFDFYLMHAQNADNFQKFKACRAYETAFALKEQGRVRHADEQGRARVADALVLARKNGEDVADDVARKAKKETDALLSEAEKNVDEAVSYLMERIEATV